MEAAGLDLYVNTAQGWNSPPLLRVVGGRGLHLRRLQEHSSITRGLAREKKHIRKGYGPKDKGEHDEDKSLYIYGR